MTDTPEELRTIAREALRKWNAGHWDAGPYQPRTAFDVVMDAVCGWLPGYTQRQLEAMERKALDMAGGSTDAFEYYVAEWVHHYAAALAAPVEPPTRKEAPQ